MAAPEHRPQQISELPTRAPSKSRTPLTDSQKQILDHWRAKAASSYASPTDCHSLANQTGLSTKQVYQYFTNLRRRKLPQPVPIVQDLGSEPPAQARHDLELDSVTEVLVRRRADARSRGRRRGRRNHRVAIAEPQPSSESQKAIKCPHCDHAFFTRQSSLRRHTETVHGLSHKTSKIWVCRPIMWEFPYFLCPVCENEMGQCKHIESFEKCWQRPHQERSFLRQDALIEHLRGRHSVREVYWKWSLCQEPLQSSRSCSDIKVIEEFGAEIFSALTRLGVDFCNPRPECLVHGLPPDRVMRALLDDGSTSVSKMAREFETNLEGFLGSVMDTLRSKVGLGQCSCDKWRCSAVGNRLSAHASSSETYSASLSITAQSSNPKARLESLATIDRSHALDGHENEQLHIPDDPTPQICPLCSSWAELDGKPTNDRLDALRKHLRLRHAASVTLDVRVSPYDSWYHSEAWRWTVQSLWDDWGKDHGKIRTLNLIPASLVR